MDLPGLIASFATAASYTVTRRTAATPVLGRAQAPTTSTLTITAAIAPASPESLERLPEGRRQDAAIEVYTTTELRTALEASTQDADLVSYDGRSWEVEAVEQWNDPISRGTAFRAVARAV